ncbi:hypothetical protein CEW92_11685 [Bacillaceae bacterium SAS-127]|nr:hypothetical protein CEW92_11685 [Bacillaceae bacterium SAS-127]
MKSLTYLMILIVISGIVVMFFINVNSERQEVMYTEVEVDYLKEKIASGDKMIVYFGRETCSACRKFNPTLNEAISATNNKDVFYLDCDNLQSREITKKYDINETPTLLTFNGDSINKYIGIQDLEKTIEILDE